MKTIALTTNLEHSIQKIRISFLALLMITFAMAMNAQNSVVDIIVSSDDHQTLEAAVIAAELADDLAGEGPFTVFAPTDEAFKALPEGTVAALLEDPTGDLAQILLYHAVSAKAMSKDLSDGQKISTLNGNSVTVKFKADKVYIDKAMVTVADIQADNGVIHVINAVMLPPSPVAQSSGGGCQTP